MQQYKPGLINGTNSLCKVSSLLANW